MKFVNLGNDEFNKLFRGADRMQHIIGQINETCLLILTFHWLNPFTMDTPNLPDARST